MWLRHYGHIRELTQQEFAKISLGRCMWPYGARTAPLRPRTGCSRSLNPYGARSIIIHASKFHGPRTGMQNSYGAARGPYGPREWTYDFWSKQPVNSPWLGPNAVGALEPSIVAHCVFMWNLIRLSRHQSGPCNGNDSVAYDATYSLYLKSQNS